MQLIDPRAAWITVLLIAGVGFINYILWKLYGTRGADVAGFLGGLVNSSVTVNELATRAIADPGGPSVRAAYRGITLATAAMLTRNIVLLGLLAPRILVYCIGAYLPMLAACVWMLRNRQRQDEAPEQASPVELELPFSLPSALKYGVLFLLMTIAGSLMIRFLGAQAYYLASFVGGLVSSASAVASAAGMVSQGVVDPWQGAVAALAASVASVFVRIPLILRVRNPELTRRMAWSTAVVTLVGLLGICAWSVAGGPWLQELEATLPH